jgi:hypothetical protein
MLLMGAFANPDAATEPADPRQLPMVFLKIRKSACKANRAETPVATAT